MWPCSPTQSAKVYIGIDGPKLMPPSKEIAQTASATDCEQYQTPCG
jgi:hypothetical protein